MRIVALWIALGAAGCANAAYGSGASSGHPPALPPGTTVPMWDHFCGVASGASGLTSLLDEASASGWEMVSYSIAGNGNLACFKRPHLEAPRTAPPPAAPPGA